MSDSSLSELGGDKSLFLTLQLFSLRSFGIRRMAFELGGDKSLFLTLRLISLRSFGIRRMAFKVGRGQVPLPYFEVV